MVSLFYLPLPYAVADWLRCTYGDAYPECSTIEEDHRRKLCEISTLQERKCHMGRHDRYKFDLWVTMDNGDVTTYYIPLVLMRGSKPADEDAGEWIEMAPWPWTNPEYVLEIPVKAKKIISIEIDPNNKIADVDRSNDIVEGESKKKS